VKSKGLSADADIDGEITRLIQTFIDTGLRLEELTGGQIDSVAGPDGQMFLLRHAQDQLRQVEASRQIAILNTLPANIALLDNNGSIISVNEAWRVFADENTIQSSDHGVGLNYLEICDRADGADLIGAQQAAAGIRSVLDGSAKNFSMEYPCDAPTEQRWFQMIVTRIITELDHSNGAVVMHQNITGRHRSKQEMTKTLERLTEAQNIGKIGDWEWDIASGSITWSSQVYAITGRDPVLGPPRDYEEQLIYYDAASQVLQREMVALTISSGKKQGCELVVVRPDGEQLHVQAYALPKMAEHGQVTGLYGTVQDITEGKNINLRIKYLNRVYAMLSSINTLMVRERDVNELYNAACRIAMETGGFKMALICIVDPATQLINLMASAGKDETLLAAIKQLILSNESATKTMIARAIREKTDVVSNNSQSDPQVLLGTVYANAGVRSQAVLPLMIANEVIGVFALYSSEVGSFHEEELMLLRELAGDIAFASDNIEKQKRIDYLAYYDLLTGLANRTLFHERLNQYIRSASNDGHKLALFVMNIERFKNLNDSLGRSAGDTLLRLVAEWLTRETGDVNLLARISADHFAMVLPQVKQEGSLERLLENAMKAFLEQPFHLVDTDYRISARVGAALFPDHGADAEILYSNAEAAMKQAKTKGIRYLFYTHSMTRSVASELTLENKLRRALNNGEFVLHYQPKVNLKTGKITSVEGLIRWNEPETGLVPPGRFIPILEETGLIYEVGRWVLYKAVDDYLRWCNTGLVVVPIAVNVSSLQLRHPGFIAEIAHAIGVDARAAAGLELEITESLIMEDIRHNITSLQAIRDMGVRIAIDDFGTGFSSLSYLAKLPMNTLKIDRSFIIEMTNSPEGLALVSTIITLAHSLRLLVIAEGVETEEQSRLLSLLNCDEIQGYLFSKPLPCEEFEARYLGKGVGDKWESFVTDPFSYYS